MVSLRARQAIVLHFTSAAGGAAQSDVATHLVAGELASPSARAMREAFKAIDHDESGVLTAENVIALGRRLGRELSAAQAAAFIEQADKDGSGS